MTASLLLLPRSLRHNPPTAPHCAVGIGVPYVKGGQAASNAAIFMFVSEVSQFWVTLRGVLALAVSFDTVRQPANVALLNWRCGGRFNQTVKGVTTMTNLALNPSVEIVNGKVTTTSNKVAEHFSKLHKDVIRAIETLECSTEFHERNFAPMQNEVKIGNGAVRKDKAYTITRDGFMFLAMGFTGKEAAQWKEAYITAFNQLEAAANKPAQPIYDEDHPAPLPDYIQRELDSFAHKLTYGAYKQTRESLETIARKLLAYGSFSERGLIEELQRCGMHLGDFQFIQRARLNQFARGMLNARQALRELEFDLQNLALETDETLDWKHMNLPCEFEGFDDEIPHLAGR